MSVITQVVKTDEEVVADYMRKAMSSFVGLPMTPDAIAKIENEMTRTVEWMKDCGMIIQPSFVSNMSVSSDGTLNADITLTMPNPCAEIKFPDIEIQVPDSLLALSSTNGDNMRPETQTDFVLLVEKDLRIATHPEDQITTGSIPLKMNEWIWPTNNTWPPGCKSIEELSELSQRNCAIGCRFFGTTVIHFCCEVGPTPSEQPVDRPYRFGIDYPSPTSYPSNVLHAPDCPICDDQEKPLGLFERVRRWFSTP